MKGNPDASPKLTVIVHDVRSILNVGAIFRTADAAGVSMIWLTGYTPGPDTHPDKMAKTALGAQLSVPWVRMCRVGDVVRKLRRQGVHIVALEQTEKSADYRRFKPKFPLAIIVGNEVKGIGAGYMSHKCRITTSELSQSGTRLCNMKGMSHNLVDACVEIPMRGKRNRSMWLLLLASHYTSSPVAGNKKTLKKYVEYFWNNSRARNFFLASRILWMVKVPYKTLERSLFGRGYKHVIGVDEVGMGCLAGPVVVCAVQFTKRFYDRTHLRLHWLRDSKLLQAHQREVFARELMADRTLLYAVAVVYPREIDKLNIFQSARSGMRRAIAKLKTKYQKSKMMVLIDGPHRIAGIPHEQMPIVKGDRKIFAIACASIIAKVYRDAMMVRYAKRFPGYGLEQHKGYGTALHRARLAALGPCPLHRRSFRGVN